MGSIRRNMEKHVYVSKIPDESGQIHWTETENKTWTKLITRQWDIIQNRACQEFIDGLDIIGFSHDRVPQHTEVNKALAGTTGWKVEPVPALIPAEDFFTLLANKTFPAASFIRIPAELDYIQEPDIFHEFYGHCPLLTQDTYATFMHEFGKLALSAEKKYRRTLFRLFWFTIEFGLINTKEGVRAYGGGMLSSINETVYSVDSDIPVRAKFDPMDCFRTPFRIDIIQPKYFVIDCFSDLYKVLELDLLKLVKEAKDLGDYDPLFKVEGAYN